MNLELWREFGLQGLIMGAVVTLLFFVVKWTLATTRDILKQAAQERVAFQDVIRGLQQATIEHNERARLFNESVNEAHRCQREEHTQLANSLTSLCQACQGFGEVHRRINEEHREIVASLARINGYKSH